MNCRDCLWHDGRCADCFLEQSADGKCESFTPLISKREEQQFAKIAKDVVQAVDRKVMNDLFAAMHAKTN